MAIALQFNPIDFSLSVTYVKDEHFQQFEYRIYEDGSDEEEAEIIPAQGLDIGGDVATIFVNRGALGNIGSTWKCDIRVRNENGKISTWTTDTVVASPNTTSVPEAEGGTPLTDYVLIDGTREMTDDWDIGPHELRAETVHVDVTTGTAPFIVDSITPVDNLGVYAANVMIEELGTATYDDVQDYIDVTGSKGVISGGGITDAGGATVDIAAATIFFRATNDPTAPLLSYDFAGDTGVAIAADTTKILYIDYNGGAPATLVGTAEDTNDERLVMLGAVVNEGGTLHVSNYPNMSNKGVWWIEHAMREVLDIQRANRLGGLALGETGTRNVTVTEGELYIGISESDISAIDTSAADTFDIYYRDGIGGFTKVAAQTQWPNAQYDDGDGGLATMITNRYSNLWFYLELDDALVMMYGQSQHISFSSALDDTPPASIPGRLENHGVLAGRIIFQKNDSTAQRIESAFAQTFGTSIVTSHNDLADLQGGTAGEYYHLTSSEQTELSAWLDDVTLSDGGDMDLGTGDITAVDAQFSGVAGIGLDWTEGTLHVHTASAGAVTAHTDADDLVVEGSATAGISILSTDAAQSRIFFGSPTDNLGAFVRWSHSDLTMRIATHISGGLLVLGTDANTAAISIDDSQVATFAGNVEIGTINAPGQATLAVQSNASHKAIEIEENSGGETWQIGVDASGHLAFFNSNSSESHIKFVDSGGEVLIQDDSLNTTSGHYGLFIDIVKTAGGTDQADDMYGLHSRIRQNDPGNTIGHLWAFRGQAILTDGIIGDGQEDIRGGHFEAQMDGGTAGLDVMGVKALADLNAGTVSGSAFGLWAEVDAESGMTAITGDIYGAFLRVDDDQGAGGTVYMLYLDELTGIDYGIYQDGTADNYFGGKVGIGIAAPSKELHVKSTTNDASEESFGLSPSTTNNRQGGLGVAAGGIISLIGNNILRFYTGGGVGDTLAMSIDASQDTTFTGDLTLPSGGIIDTASGNLILQPAGDIILDPDGLDVFPGAGYEVNLGSLSNKYLTLHAAELWVETLVAQDTVATIGGRILVGPTTALTEDFGSGETTITVKHNQMASGDRVYMEADGKVEFMSVDSAAGGGGPYTYTVTRNLDGSGANDWYAGDAVFNTGAAGDGFNDLYSYSGVTSGTTGPTIVGNVRNSATYNDWSEHWAIGNLDGLYGYGSTTYGVGLGEYSATTAFITIDSTDGYRVHADNRVVAQWKVDGDIVFFDDGDDERILIGTISSTATEYGLKVHDNSAGDQSSIWVRRIAPAQGGGSSFYWNCDGTDPGANDDFDVQALTIDADAMVTASHYFYGISISADAAGIAGVIKGIDIDAGDYSESARAGIDRYGVDSRAEGNTTGEIYGIYGSARNANAAGEMYGGYFTINLAPSVATTGAGIYAAGNAALSLPAIEAFGDVDITGDVTASGTVQAEHLYSTDDLQVDDDAHIGGLLEVDSRVGINVTPTYTLDIDGSSPSIRLKWSADAAAGLGLISSAATGSPRLFFQNSEGGFSVRTDGTNYLIGSGATFDGSSGTTKWTLQTDGDVVMTGQLTGVTAVTASATIQAEHLYSTDDAVIDDVLAVGGYAEIGTTHALEGALRLENTGYIFSRNAGNTNSIKLLGADASNFILIGDDASAGVKLFSEVIAGDNPLFYIYGDHGGTPKYGRHSVGIGGTYLIESEDWMQLNSGGSLFLQADADDPIYLDAGDVVTVRDVDAANATRWSVDTATGDVTMYGDITNNSGSWDIGSAADLTITPTTDIIMEAGGDTVALLTNNNNTLEYPFVVRKERTSGGSSDGFGVGIEFELDNDGPTLTTAGRFGVFWSDVSDGDSEFYWYTRDGDVENLAMRLSAAGGLFTDAVVGSTFEFQPGAERGDYPVGTFDEEDDPVLLEDFANRRGIEKLVELGIMVPKPYPYHGFMIDHTKLFQLFAGGIYQNAHRAEDIEKDLEREEIKNKDLRKNLMSFEKRLAALEQAA